MAERTGRGRPDSTTPAGWSLIRAAVREQRVGIGVAVAAGLLWTAAKVSTGLLVKHAIDDGIKADDPDALRTWSLILGGVAVASAVFTGLRRYQAFRVARWVETDLRERMFAHLQRLHFGFHDRAQTGELMSRTNTDLQQVQSFLVMIPLTISNGATVLAVTAILVTIDPLLTLLALGSLPLMNVLATRFSRRLHPYVMGIQRESAQLAAVVEESVAGVRVVKGLGAEEIQAARLQAEADDVFSESLGAARTRAQFVPALELLPMIGFIAVLGYGGHRVLEGSLSLGDLVAFNVYVTMLIWPLRMMGWIVAQAQRAAVSAGRVEEVLATEPEITDPAEPMSLPVVVRNGGASGNGGDGGVRREAMGEVRFDDVVFRYGEGAPVLDGFDLTIRPGESVALVGATGSGKSTIGRLLPRYYDVSGGRILLDGVDVRRVALGELRRAVGIVFEETFLFSDTVAMNIAFADPDASHEQVVRAARLAGADDFVRELSGGYGTRIGERGYSLSGGQRQRLAIARAIVADPRVLILDDATSAVDPTKEHEIRGALGEVMAGRTTLVIAHRPATIALADRVVLVDGGRVAATGTHDELLATSSRYREVLAAGGRHRVEEHAEEHAEDHDDRGTHVA